jgi:hypothetical protein
LFDNTLPELGASFAKNLTLLTSFKGSLMLKLLILITVMLSSSAFAGPEEQMLSIKERLRISLWVEGINESAPQDRIQVDPQKVDLPEEIERALKKL